MNQRPDLFIMKNYIICENMFEIDQKLLEIIYN
jgi:hypothetical protein